MLDATQRKGWGGVGHVNVHCTLLTCWMLRNWRVGVGWGMLTFLLRCTHVGCYTTEGLGWGGASLCFSLIAAACWYHLLSKSTVCCVACCQAATKTPKIQQGLPCQSFKQCAYCPWWGASNQSRGCPRRLVVLLSFCGTPFLDCFFPFFP